MTLPFVYRILNNISFTAEMEIDCPSGGTLSLQSVEQQELLLQCSDGAALWDGVRLLTMHGLGLRSLRLLSSPLQQPLNVVVGGEPFLRWNPGKFPRFSSFRRLVSWLRG